MVVFCTENEIRPAINPKEHTPNELSVSYLLCCRLCFLDFGFAFYLEFLDS